MNSYQTIYKISVLTVCLVMSIAAMSQARYFDERYISTQSFINPVLINPGEVGGSEYHRIIGNYRNNWASFPGSPKTVLLNYDGPVGNRIGIGVQVLSDSNGGLSTTKGMGTVSYTLESTTNTIGFGLSGEYIQHSANSDDYLNNGQNDQNDQVVLGRLDGINYFDVSFGVSGIYDNSIKYGLVLPSLASSRLDDTDDEFSSDFSYIFHIGYLWNVAGYDLNIEPSIFLKKLDYVPFHLDINAKANFLNDRLTGGLTYTVGADEKIGFLIGARVNSFNFYYTYNVSRNEFQTYNNGGHEISFKFELGRNDNKIMTEQEMDAISPTN